MVPDFCATCQNELNLPRISTVIKICSLLIFYVIISSYLQNVFDCRFKNDVCFAEASGSSLSLEVRESQYLRLIF